MIAFKTVIQLIGLCSAFQIALSTPTQQSPQAELFRRDASAGCYDTSYQPPSVTDCDNAFNALPFNKPDRNNNTLLDSQETTVTKKSGLCEIRIQCNGKPVQASRQNLYGVSGKGGYQYIRDICLTKSKAGSATVTGQCTVQATHTMT